MTQKEFNSLTFSQRHEISKGTKCNASWQVRTIGGSAAYAISCRECGTVLQSDCTPKCLLLHPPLTDVNPHVSGKLQDVIEDCLFDFKNEEQPLSVCVAQILAACAATKGGQSG